MKCRIYQWWLANAVDQGTVPGERLTLHMASCLACRAYYQAQLKTDRMLAQEEPSSCQYSRPFSLSQLQQTEACTPSKIGVSRTGWRIAASILIVVGIGLSTILVMRHRQKQMIEQTAALASALTLPEEWNPSQLLTTYATKVPAPLEAEMKNLSLDAQSTARFLAKCSPFGFQEQP